MKTYGAVLILVACFNSSAIAASPEFRFGAPTAACNYEAVEQELMAEGLSEVHARGYRLASESLVNALNALGMRLSVVPYALTVDQFRRALESVAGTQERKELFLAAIRTLQLQRTATSRVIRDPACLGME